MQVNINVPKVGGSKKKRSKKRRSINDLKGHFLYGGQMGVNRACAPNDTPTKSELAWDSRHKVMKGGDGYSLFAWKINWRYARNFKIYKYL